METLEQKKRRLYGKKYLPIYLEELNLLLNRRVNSTDLLSIIESDIISNKCSLLDRNLLYKEIIPFDSKGRLIEVFKNHLCLNKPFYMYIAYSSDCGYMKLNTLEEFNFYFPFDAEHGGIITFTSEDEKVYVILDFYEEDNNRYIEFEIYKLESRCL